MFGGTPAFITCSGYLDVAAANNIIVLFPQTTWSMSDPFSLAGCWDVAGYTGMRGCQYQDSTAHIRTNSRTHKAAMYYYFPLFQHKRRELNWFFTWTGLCMSIGKVNGDFRKTLPGYSYTQSPQADIYVCVGTETLLKASLFNVMRKKERVDRKMNDTNYNGMWLLNAHIAILSYTGSLYGKCWLLN